MAWGGDHEDVDQVLGDTELETTFAAQLEQETLKLQEMDGDCHLAELENLLFDQDVDDAFAKQVTQM